MTKELFNQITAWQSETFPNATSFSKIKHLEEEIVELKEALVNHPTIDGEVQFPLELDFADCFFLLYGAAKAAGMTYESINKAIEVKLNINQDRVWGKPDSDGVVKHVPGTKKFSTDEHF